MAKNILPTILIRAVIEIRFTKKRFGIIDQRGTIVDDLTSDNSYTKIRISSERIDLTNDGLSKKFFLSPANVGIQREGLSSLTKFRDTISNFLSDEILKEVVGEEQLIRIGTKASIFYFRRGMGSYEQIQKIYRQKVQNEPDALDNAVSGRIVDRSYTYDFMSDKKKGHLFMAPITKKQAIDLFFEDTEIYRNMNADHGLFFDIDVYDDEIKSLTFSDASGLSLECWDAVESTYDNLLNELLGD
ncbi:MAG TPA: hypothetical protein VLG37_00420 [Candidatus Saccharimonadales bacterium]|nr:hypothetical protein [Candidatus Saccharimonadales bacterium]